MNIIIEVVVTDRFHSISQIANFGYHLMKTYSFDPVLLWIKSALVTPISLVIGLHSSIPFIRKYWVGQIDLI